MSLTNVKVAPGTDPVGENSANFNTQPQQTQVIFTIQAPTTTVVIVPNPQPSEAQVEPIKLFYPKKRLCEAYVLWFPLGILGAHHFYLRRYAFGFLYFFTLGLCGIGWIGDAFRLPKLVREANERMAHPEIEPPLDVFDAYTMWFPFGIFGLHHFYMGRVSWGIMYSWTSGLYGIGWLVDAFRIPSLVRQANKDLPVQRAMEDHPRSAELATAYLLGVTPAGLFGAHHFYMGQWRYGLFYLYTMGGAGIGWICDWFRMHVLVKRVNHPENYPLKNKQKHLDSAYICAFPFGVVGGHHFYLGDAKMGTIYFFTLGIFGLGWIVDLFRMPWLVKDANARLIREQELVGDIRRRLGIHPTIILPPGRLPEPQMFHHNVPGYPINVNIEMTQPPVVQPPSYSEAISQPYNPPSFLGAEGGPIDQITAPTVDSTKEQDTKV